MIKLSYKKIINNKLFRPMFVIYTVLSISLYLFIPTQLDDAIEKFTIQESFEMMNFLEATKMYYNDFIIDDIQKHIKNNSNVRFNFAANHKNESGTLPLPATFLHDLSAMATEDRITRLYSDYPFKPRKDRILTKDQKDVLKRLSTMKGKILIEMTVIDGVDYARVAKANYMTHDTCVDCHNNHLHKMWSEDKWKIGDMRGVLETLTPVNNTIRIELDRVRINIVWMVMFSFLVSFLYYGYVMIKREAELENINNDLELEYSDYTKAMNLKNLALEHNLSDLFNDFDKTVIYSKTNLFGTITDASQAFCKISGYSKKELLGQLHNIVRHQDTQPEVYQDMWQTLKADKVWSGVIKNKRKNGTHYWVESIISPNYDHEGVKIGYTSIRHNVTKEKDKHLKTLKVKLKGKRAKKRTKEIL